MADHPQPYIFPSPWHRRQHEARRARQLAPELRIRQLSSNAIKLNIKRCVLELHHLVDELERRGD
jgi:hypothetical protein